MWWLLMACRTDPPPSPATVADDVCEQATWDVAAEPVLRTWCTPCHASSLEGAERSGAPEGIDFDTWSLAAPWAEAIRSASVPDDARMPPEGQPTAEEREWLGHWVDCGAPGSDAVLDPCAAPTTAPVGNTDPCAEGHGHVPGDLTPAPEAALDCLCTVDGDLDLSGRADIDLPLLQHLGGFLALQGVQQLSAPRLRAAEAIELDDEPGLHHLDLSGLEHVGRLHLVRSGTDATVALPQLAVVDESLRVEALPDLEVLRLPRLRQVGSLHLVDNPRLVSLPNTTTLEAVHGDLHVTGNPALEELSLASQLLTLDGGLDIGRNGLVSLSLPYVLPSLGTLSIHDEPDLVAIDGLDELSSVADVAFVGLGTLGAVELPTLHTVDGTLRLEGLGIADLQGLTALRHLHGDLVVRDNPLLDPAAVDALLEQLDTHDGTVVVE